MKRFIDKETEKRVKALVDKANQGDSDDKPYEKACDFLYEKLKGKKVAITETYSINEGDIEEIINTFSFNTSDDLNKLFYEDISEWHNINDPISVEIKVV